MAEPRDIQVVLPADILAQDNPEGEAVPAVGNNAVEEPQPLPQPQAGEVCSLRTFSYAPLVLCIVYLDVTEFAYTHPHATRSRSWLDFKRPEKGIRTPWL